MRSRVRPVPFFGALACALVLVVAAPAGASSDPSAAASYLATQQNAGTDPGAGAGAWDASPGFEFQTTEVVLALAEAAQTGASWDPAAARAAVAATTNADGVSPLPFLDDFAEAASTPAHAAKLLLLVALPLDDGTPGFAPAAWDPGGDGNPVDLPALLGCGGSPTGFGFLNETLYGIQAWALACGGVPTAALDTVRAGQQADGGWSYDNDPSGATPADVDTTGNVVLALVAGGAAPDDPAVVAALGWLAREQTADGWWPGYDGEASPDSSSRAMLAVTAAGYDVDDPCWRDTVAPDLADDPYASPDDALAALQQPDGSVVGPTTFSAVYATAQAVQGTQRTWLPVVRGDAPCDAPGPDDPPIVDPGVQAPSGAGVPAVEDGATSPGQLPRTGSEGALALVGGLAVGLGALLVRASRRRIAEVQ